MVTSPPPAVELSELTKTFRTPSGDVKAVSGVDLTVQHGEIVAFLGPNGAGKTTTLDIVLGLTSPTSGSATVFGLSPERAIDCGRVSAVLQTGGLLRDLTVRETVELIASTYQQVRDVDDVIAQAGITGLARRRVSKCSGGEQQRLRFALALLPDPDLLVLDEPTAGMDVVARREFWDTMRADTAAGRTVIFATHYLEEADSFADRIVLISAGRVVADGPIAEIRARTGGRSISARVPEPLIPQAISVLERLPGVHRVQSRTGRLIVTADTSDEVARLLLVELGGTDLEITSGGLDEVFMELVDGNGGSAS